MRPRLAKHTRYGECGRPTVGDDGYARTASVRNGDLYSYETVIATWFEGHVLLDMHRYSNATAKLQFTVHQEGDVLSAKDLVLYPDSKRDHEHNLVCFWRELIEAEKKLSRARSTWSIRIWVQVIKGKLKCIETYERISKVKLGKRIRNNVVAEVYGKQKRKREYTAWLQSESVSGAS